jgi:hypothetical protein
MLLTCLFVLHFQFNVSLSSEMQFGMIQFFNMGNFHSGHMNFVLVCLFRVTCTVPNSIPFKSQHASGIKSF